MSYLRNWKGNAAGLAVLIRYGRWGFVYMCDAILEQREQTDHVILKGGKEEEEGRFLYWFDSVCMRGGNKTEKREKNKKLCHARLSRAPSVDSICFVMASTVYKYKEGWVARGSERNPNYKVVRERESSLREWTTLQVLYIFSAVEWGLQFSRLFSPLSALSGCSFSFFLYSTHV